jgi:hypothetical protein
MTDPQARSKPAADEGMRNRAATIVASPTFQLIEAGAGPPFLTSILLRQDWDEVSPRIALFADREMGRDHDAEACIGVAHGRLVARFLQQMLSSGKGKAYDVRRRLRFWFGFCGLSRRSSMGDVLWLGRGRLDSGRLFDGRWLHFSDDCRRPPAAPAACDNEGDNGGRGNCDESTHLGGSSRSWIETARILLTSPVSPLSSI